MNPAARRRLLTAAPAVLLAVLVWRVGTGPFARGIGAVDPSALLFAAAAGAAATVCCAWRWTIVARGLGIDLSLKTAVAAYYRSQFLNVTLPGGIVGDVHRGITHGRGGPAGSRDAGSGLRAVAWERAAGQLVQTLITAVVLLALPSPVHRVMLFAALLAVPAGAVAAIVIALGPGGRPGRRRLPGAALRDLRAALPRRAWAPVALSSAFVVAAHTAAFVVAASTAGTHASLARMLPITLLAMTAMVLPSVGGWGPREGVTAWAFAAAGLGLQQGLATAVVYGVMTFVATLPGAVLLAADWLARAYSHHRGADATRERSTHRPLRQRPIHA